MNRERVQNQRGFSLLELFVTVAILAIGLLGLAQLMGLAVQQNDFARYNTAAIQVARGKLENLKAAYNQQLATGVPSADLTDGQHGPETVTLEADNSVYGQRSLVVGWAVTSPTTTRKDIVISVTPSTATQSLLSKIVTVNTTLSP